MKAAILAVGSELLGVDRLDTNSLRLTRLLHAHGVELGWKGVVGDDETALASEIARLLATFDLVLVGGGLGPTADDVTREAAARALGRELVHDAGVEAAIAAMFARIGRRMASVNLRQARVIAGATVLENRWGTAPGMLVEENGRALFLLPGVPSELERMAAHHLEPWLAARSGGVEVEQRTLRVACLPESTVEERILPAYAEFGRDDITVLASAGDILLRLTARGDEAARTARLDAMAGRLAALVGEALYSQDGERGLETTVGDLLQERRLTLATAESCTGGLVAERVTRVPGSSSYFVGSIVAYANAAKLALLEVPEALLTRDGAVSESVARAMAAGVRTRLGTSLGLAVTGVAGPGGGSETKPVGSVHLALAGPGDAETVHTEVRFPGDRERVRWLTSQLALEMVRRRLLGLEPPSWGAADRRG